MKKVIIILVLVLVSLVASAHGSLDYRLKLSEVVFTAQKVLNPVLETSGKTYLSVQDMQKVLGAAKYKQFAKAIIFLYNNERIKQNAKGSKEDTNNILKLKYGKRFANLKTLTYIRTDYKKNSTEIIYNFRSFKERIKK